MEEFIKALMIKPKDIEQMIEVYNKLPNESILKDAIYLQLITYKRMLKYISERKKKNV